MDPPAEVRTSAARRRGGRPGASCARCRTPRRAAPRSSAVVRGSPRRRRPARAPTAPGSRRSPPRRAARGRRSTPSTPRIAASTAPGSIPRGDASRKTRELSRRSRYAAAAISAATTSAATASAWIQPVQRITRPGDQRGDEGEQVGDDVPVGTGDVEAAPVGPGEQRGRSEVDQDADRGHDRQGTAGDVRRVDEAAYALDHEHHDQHREGQPVDLSGQDLGPLQPVGVGPGAGRAASRIATSASPIAPASVSMWPASASSASDPTTRPTTTSPTRKATISASAPSSSRRSPSRSMPVRVVVRHRSPSVSPTSVAHRGREAGAQLVQ